MEAVTKQCCIANLPPSPSNKNATFECPECGQQWITGDHYEAKAHGTTVGVCFQWRKVEPK